MYYKHMILIPIFTLIFVPEFQAQNILYPQDNILDIITLINKQYAYDEDSSAVKGSPFLNNEFIPGQVVYHNGKIIEPIPFRYNLYRDKMEYYQDERVMELLEVPAIDRIIYDGRAFVYRKIEVDRNNKEGYFQLLSEGKVELLGKLSARYLAPQEKVVMMDAVPGQFVRDPDVFFILREDGSYEKVGNVKKLIASLGEYESELRTFAKKEKISARKGEELGQLIDYYNQLTRK